MIISLFISLSRRLRRVVGSLRKPQAMRLVKTDSIRFSAQNGKLLQIVEAFENGKRLNELPHVGTTNPFNLLVEVLDTDGESKQAQLATLLPYIEDECSYGIEWDTAVP